jgi:hypothetical protein
MNFPIDHHQFLIYFPWYLDFLDHSCYMRGIPLGGTYRLLTVFGRTKRLPRKGYFAGKI